MLITAEILYKYNQIFVADDEASKELLEIQIGTACQIINDYVGFDTDEVLAEGSTFTAAEKALFRQTALRIATLLQEENGGNIGVNSAAGIDGQVSRSFLNVVNYTPYLEPLSAFRRNTEM